MGRSLFDHHLRQHAPAVSLDIQYRMHPRLCDYPNKRTSGSRLKNDESTNQIQIDRIFANRLYEWAKRYWSLMEPQTAGFGQHLAINQCQGFSDRNEQFRIAVESPKYQSRCRITVGCLQGRTIPSVPNHHHDAVQRPDNGVFEDLR